MEQGAEGQSPPLSGSITASQFALIDTKVRAKDVVADDEAVFVTSANLTEAALDWNIEIGLLVRDRALAASLIGHFEGLIDLGMLCLLPGN